MDKIIHHFLNSVIAIGTPDNKNNIVWIGTGFIVSKKTNDTNNLSYYIITNKHVLKNIKIMCVRFNSSGNELTKEYKFTLKDDNNSIAYSNHSDDRIDIVAIRFNPEVLINDQIIWKAISLEEQTFSLAQMRNNDMLEGTIVYSLGFPMSLVENIKTPICRLGCISRIRNTFFNKETYPSFLVDAQAYPGNSGGPIISDYKLIGILNSCILYEDVLFSHQSGKSRMILSENSGLTNVFPVDRIKEVVDLEYARTKSRTKM